MVSGSKEGGGERGRKGFTTAFTGWGGIKGDPEKGWGTLWGKKGWDCRWVGVGHRGGRILGNEEHEEGMGGKERGRRRARRRARRRGIQTRRGDAYDDHDGDGDEYEKEGGQG
eukprot:766887-Hanusia_phi.AAC.1